MREKTMKKILGVSIAAMLAVTPMMANATGLGTAGDSSITYSDGTSTKPTITSGKNIATTTYVQGAYDALAEKHNALDTRVGLLESSDSTEGSILNAVKTKAEDAKYTADTTHGANLTTDTTLNTAIDTLDQDMGKTADLNKNVGGTAFGEGTTLYNFSGSLVKAVQTVAAAVDSANSANSTATTVEDGSFIEATGSVADNLEALDAAATSNSQAITAVLNSTIPVYGSWATPNTQTNTVSIGSLQGTGTGLPVAPATVPAQSGDD